MTAPRRILAIDDNADDLALVVRILTTHYKGQLITRTATSRAQATEALHAPWDVILSDYLMPTFPWPQPLMLCKHSAPDTPLVVISGVLPADWVIPSGVDGYLLKSDLSQMGPYLDMLIRSTNAHAAQASATANLKDQIERLSGDG